jgi:hypothetical protein
VDTSTEPTTPTEPDDDYVTENPGAINVTGWPLSKIAAAAAARGLPADTPIVYGYCGSHQVYLDPAER